MRAARLLQMLLLLQNRGRMTSANLAEHLEVSRRTILRDVDAMTEAGLPIIVHHGQYGGIELGFDYRTRLTGLTDDEAEALGIMLARPMPELGTLGLRTAGRLAASKIAETFPEKIRAKMASSAARFQLCVAETGLDDVRISAMAKAVRDQRIVQIATKSPHPRTIHPVVMKLGGDDCAVCDGLAGNETIGIADWGDINISAKRFA